MVTARPPTERIEPRRASGPPTLDEAGRFLLAPEGLASLPHLTHLVLGPGFGDRELTELRHVRHLTALHLEHTRVTGAGFAALANLATLEELDLTCGSVDDAGLGHLTHLGGLRGLHLANNRVTDEGVRRLPRLPHLRSLGLSRTGVSDSGLALLPDKTPSLEKLYVRQLHVSDRSCEVLRLFDDLQELSLGDESTPGITDACLEALGSLAGLREIGLSNTRITSAGLRSLHHLRELIAFVGRDTDLDDFGVVTLVRFHGRSLQRLDLSGTRITDRALEYLSRATSPCDELRRLDVRGTLVTHAAVVQLRRRWSKLVIVSDFDEDR